MPRGDVVFFLSLRPVSCEYYHHKSVNVDYYLSTNMQQAMENERHNTIIQICTVYCFLLLLCTVSFHTFVQNFKMTLKAAHCIKHV